MIVLDVFLETSLYSGVDEILTESRFSPPGRFCPLKAMDLIEAVSMSLGLSSGVVPGARQRDYGEFRSVETC